MDVEDVLALAFNAARADESVDAVLPVLVQHGARELIVREALAVCSDRYGVEARDVKRARDLLERCLFSGALRP